MLFQSSLYVVIPVFIFIPLIKKSGEGLIPLGNLVLIKHVLWWVDIYVTKLELQHCSVKMKMSDILKTWLLVLYS